MRIVALVFALSAFAALIVIPQIIWNRKFRKLESELIAQYGEDQIKGLNIREIYLLLRTGLLRPIGKGK